MNLFTAFRFSGVGRTESENQFLLSLLTIRDG